MVALQEFHVQIRKAVELGEMSRSRRLCETVLSFYPENLETLLLQAEVDLECGAYRPAARGFERVLSGDPEGYVACAGLAIAQEGLRDPAAALHWLGRALDLNPANGEIRAERDRLFAQAYPGVPLPERLSEFVSARLLLDIGRYAEALDGLRRALAQEPGRSEVKVGLAELLWTCGRPGEARLLCEELLSDIPSVVKAKAILACILADEGNLPRARAILAEAQAQDPAGRIAGHLIKQTALSAWSTLPLDVPVAVAEALEGEFVSAEFPSWSHWMREALWRLLRLVVPGEHEDDREELVQGRDLHAGSTSLPAPHRAPVQEHEPVGVEPLADESTGIAAARSATPEGATPVAQTPRPSESGRQPDPAPREEAPRRRRRASSPESPDPDATEIIDEPGWLRLRNELRREQESRD